MNWILQKQSDGRWFQAVEAPRLTLKAARDAANYRRPIARTETWRAIDEGTGETWQCTFEPRKRAKWRKV